MKLSLRTICLLGLLGGIGLVLFFASYDYLTGSPGDGFGSVQRVGVVSGFVLILIAGNYFFRFLMRSFFLLLGILGMVLLSLNLYGEFVSLRSPNVYEGASYGSKHRIPEQYYGNEQDQLQRGQEETYRQYAHRLTARVYDLTIHLWNDSVDYRTYNHQVPLHENYLLWILSYTEPNVYRYYEFCDPYKAIERGVSVCSQATKALVSLWKAQTGLRAHDIVLDGHVVAEVEVDRDADLWWILDADYGVVLEHPISTLERQPELIVDAYKAAGYSQKVTDKVVAIYGKDGNYVASNKGICAREQRLYKAKWSIPLGLLGVTVLYFVSVWVVRNHRSQASL